MMPCTQIKTHSHMFREKRYLSYMTGQFQEGSKQRPVTSIRFILQFSAQEEYMMNPTMSKSNCPTLHKLKKLGQRSSSPTSPGRPVGVRVHPCVRPWPAGGGLPAAAGGLESSGGGTADRRAGGARAKAESMLRAANLSVPVADASVGFHLFQSFVG